MPVLTADIGDVADICRLVNFSYRGDSSKIGWTSEADLLDGTRINEATLKYYFRDPKIKILKYLDYAIIVGCVYLETLESKLYLGMLTVHPDLQNQGIGKKLLTAAEKFAIDNNLRIIIMTVISSRHELIDWYLRRGYSDTGEKKPFHHDKKFGIPRQPIELIVLEKRL